MIKPTLAAVPLAFASLALASTAVQADPPARCAVEVARAPDEVRVAIDQWIAGEPRCGAPLIVRVIADDGQLFVLAHDDRGRIYERAVPDAESVAALVASWAAPPEAVAAPATTPVAAPPVAAEDRGEAAATAAARPGVPRGRVGARVIVGEQDSVGFGLAGRYDALRSGRWSGAVTTGVTMTSGESLGVSWQAQGAQLGVAAAWTLVHAGWRGRAELGLGWLVSRNVGFSSEWSAWSSGAYVGVGAEVERAITRRWAGFVAASAEVGRQTLGDALHDITDFSNDQRYLSAAVGVSTTL